MTRLPFGARIALLCFAVFAVMPVPAFAQETPCASRGELVEQLAVRYGETLRGGGDRSRGARLELFATDDGGTWTLLFSLPDGTACIVDAGVRWSIEGGPKGRFSIRGLRAP